LMAASRPQVFSRPGDISIGDVAERILHGISGASPPFRLSSSSGPDQASWCQGAAGAPDAGTKRRVATSLLRAGLPPHHLGSAPSASAPAGWKGTPCTAPLNKQPFTTTGICVNSEGWRPPSWLATLVDTSRRVALSPSRALDVDCARGRSASPGARQHQ
jgi:hypothetical protein